MPKYKLKRTRYRAAQIRSDAILNSHADDHYTSRSPVFATKKRTFSGITEKSTSSSDEDERPQRPFRTPLPAPKQETINENPEQVHSASEMSRGHFCKLPPTPQSSKLIEVEVDYLKEILSLLKQQDTALNKLVRNQSLQHVMLTDICEDVQQIKSQIIKITPDQPEDEQEYNIFVKLEKLPASCQDDLQLLEEFLSHEEQMNKTAKQMASLGGNSIYEFIVRASQKLITNSCGAEYSYLGRKKKKPFIELKLWHLLMKSSKIVFPKSTEKEIEEQISKWLKRCAERAKSKKEVSTEF